ncbi:MAG: flavin reductase family protein [Hyphomicrobiales bacterium]
MTIPANFDRSAEGPVSSDLFREAMSRVGSAVHIVTTDGIAGRAGLTATAFSAVSDAPPIVLVCVNRLSRSHGVIMQNKVFCVNTLSSGAEQLANLFAGRSGAAAVEDRFEGLDVSRASTGAPVMPDVLMAVDCLLRDTVEMGTHTVFFGSVLHVTVGADEQGLIYQGRSYKSV